MYAAGRTKPCKHGRARHANIVRGLHVHHGSTANDKDKSHYTTTGTIQFSVHNDITGHPADEAVSSESYR